MLFIDAITVVHIHSWMKNQFACVKKTDYFFMTKENTSANWHDMTWWSSRSIFGITWRFGSNSSLMVYSRTYFSTVHCTLFVTIDSIRFIRASLTHNKSINQSRIRTLVLPRTKTKNKSNRKCQWHITKLLFNNQLYYITHHVTTYELLIERKATSSKANTNRRDCRLLDLVFDDGICYDALIYNVNLQNHLGDAEHSLEL